MPPIRRSGTSASPEYAPTPHHLDGLRLASPRNLSGSMDRHPSHKLKVAFVLAPNFTMSAFAGFVDSLRLAADDSDRSRPVRWAWDVVSDSMEPIRSSCGIRVLPTTYMSAPDRYAYVALVGGLLHHAVLPRSSSAFVALAAQRGVKLIGICTGVFYLAELGLLDSTTCCVSWFHAKEFAHRYPSIALDAEAQYVADGDRLTCAGGVGVVRLAEHMIREHFGPHLARKAMQMLQAQPQGVSVETQPGDPYHLETRDPRVKKAIMLMERNLATPISLEFVAKYLELSQRQMERLFRASLGMSPAQVYLDLRLLQAHRLLSANGVRTRDISVECGFVSPSHFANVFRRRFGIAPAMVRRAGSSNR